MLTTGIFLLANCWSDGPIAAVSCGVSTTARTPWLMNAWVLEISLEMSFCEFVVFRSTPRL